MPRRSRKRWWYSIWWVGDDEAPSWAEAPRRLEHLDDRGPTPYTFYFRTPFDVRGQPTRLVPASQRAT
jgi:hypothetical protein